MTAQDVIKELVAKFAQFGLDARVVEFDLKQHAQQRLISIRDKQNRLKAADDPMDSFCIRDVVKVGRNLVARVDILSQEYTFPAARITYELQT